MLLKLWMQARLSDLDDQLEGHQAGSLYQLKHSLLSECSEDAQERIGPRAFNFEPRSGLKIRDVDADCPVSLSDATGDGKVMSFPTSRQIPVLGTLYN